MYGTTTFENLNYIFLVQEKISTTGNSKCFWTLIKSTRNSGSILSQTADGVMTVNSYKDVADMLKSFFKSMYVTDDSKSMPPHIIPNLSV